MTSPLVSSPPPPHAVATRANPAINVLIRRAACIDIPSSSNARSVVTARKQGVSKDQLNAAEQPDDRRTDRGIGPDRSPCHRLRQPIDLRDEAEGLQRVEFVHRYRATVDLEAGEGVEGHQDHPAVIGRLNLDRRRTLDPGDIEPAPAPGFSSIAACTPCSVSTTSTWTAVSAAADNSTGARRRPGSCSGPPNAEVP